MSYVLDIFFIMYHYYVRIDMFKCSIPHHHVSMQTKFCSCNKEENLQINCSAKLVQVKVYNQIKDSPITEFERR